MKKLWLIFFFIPVQFASAQELPKGAIISGPMIGQVEMRTATLWLQVSADVSSISLKYWKEGRMDKSWLISITSPLLKESLTEFNPIKFDLKDLDFNTRYEYQFNINNVNSVATGTFKTKDLWQWRKPAPDFSFLTGSCAYFNEPEYDRPGKPYGGDSVIFESM
ncbi:MAG TPA: hypothetical protein VK711_13230, partial [Puia sp.]|nr:hypothetical protein [Puia sp.]